ncbi:MAG: TROVE domain-containing protein [Clostridia bacterium]|jgi:hypothetical protein
MAKLNTATKKDPIFTHEGAKAQHINPYQQLRRSVCSCMLWESEFYEDGETIANRIASLVKEVPAEKVADLAIEAREKFKLRHVPLLLVRELARIGYKKTAEVLKEVIQRPNELTEFLSIYWKDGRCPLSAQVKKGLAAAFPKFNAYQLAKYNRDEKVKLRDVLFLSHAKAKDKEQEVVWKKLIDGTLEAPDTWEVALSAGKDKKATWERLLSEGKLGALALLRNLRNMKEANVTENVIFNSLNSVKIDRILPFRFISAAKYAPQWEAQLEPVMLKCCADKEKLFGKTVLVVDGSGSMFGTPISKKSEIDRFEAAAALAILVREICESVAVIVFSCNPFVIPSRRGFALRDSLYSKAEKGGTNTQIAIDLANREHYDRIIIITDEQSHRYIQPPNGKGYVINVASARNGIGYGAWKHIDGFSEAVIDWIREYENLQ